MYIVCQGLAIAMLFFNNVAADWSKNGSIVQVRLPSACSSLLGTTQLSRIRDKIRRMLECGLKPVEIARDISELQYAVALSGHRQSYASNARSNHVPNAIC